MRTSFVGEDISQVPRFQCLHQSRLLIHRISWREIIYVEKVINLSSLMMVSFADTIRRMNTFLRPTPAFYISSRVPSDRSGGSRWGVETVRWSCVRRLRTGNLARS